jgi:Cdc6-like AAA superfamily ATPase
MLINRKFIVAFNNTIGGTWLKIYYDAESIDKSEFQEIIENLKKFVSVFNYEESFENKISLVVSDNGRLSLSDFQFKDFSIKIDQNYNDDFSAVHNKIFEKLQEDKSKGLVLLHGKPGTGKTTYIRHLIQNCKKRKIYLPSDLSHELSLPNFIPFLQNHVNSILIIEDAENIIQQRHGGGSGAIANLLNLTDGLLSDVLNIQIVCTFNTSISKIDSALLRKGRLIASYGFEELSIEKSKQLVNENELNFEVTQPMTLAEIFNHSPEEKNVLDVGHLNGNTPIGFRMQPIPTADDYLLPSHKK